MPVESDLIQARERAGLSAKEIADRTKIQLQRIKALESGNFDALPHGVYLQGIVRSYAREVGLDAATLIERLRREQPQFVEDLNLRLKDATPSNDGRILTIETHPTQTLESFEPELKERAPGEPNHERPARGLAERALPIVSLLAVVGWGAFFYQLTRPVDRSLTRQVATSTGAVERPSQTEMPVAAPPETKAVLEPTPREEPPVSDAAREAARGSIPATPKMPALAPPSPEPTVPPPATIDARAAAQKSNEPAPKHNVAGSWSLATTVETSSDAPVAGLRRGYEIQLKQDGGRVEGKGKKTTENGAAIDLPAQTPISMTGTIQGDRLTLVFNEGATPRPTVGKFVMLVEDGIMRGRFSSTATRSTGTVEALRR